MINHLWQSTVFAAVAGLLTVAFRKNRARVRYWLWFSASLKFFVPFSLLIGLGSHLQTASPVPRIAAPAVSLAIGQAVQPFSETAPFVPAPGARDWVLLAIFAAWAFGFAAIVLIRFRGWLRVRAAVRASTPLTIPSLIPALIDVRSSPGLLEPGVVGFLRPILLVPAGIEERLTPHQLDAVLAHEQCHVRRRDNLTAAIHMIVEAIFWFHPFVWWIGARLVEERERACDEEVLSQGGEPGVYAEAILNVCKLYVESPLVCVSGVTGADLKKRIEAIMANRTALRLNAAKKVALAAIGAFALAVPIVIGMMNLPRLRAQAAIPKFEVASIRPCEGNGGGRGGKDGSQSPARLHMNCQPVANLIESAYIRFASGRLHMSARSAQPFKGGPAWINSESYQIDAKPESPQSFAMLRGPMLQQLLEDRFKLKIHRETREVPVYLLTVAKGGPKNLPATAEGSCAPLDPDHLPGPDTKLCGFFHSSANEGIDTSGQTMAGLCLQFSTNLDRDVIDKTGITGMFDIHLDVSMADLFPRRDSDGPADPSSIVSAIQDALKRLGLKLEAAKAPVEFLVIDHVERPSEN